jgi:hypothetical protein
MIGYILTQENYDQVQGQFYTDSQFFNCVQDINDIWFTFLTELDKETILNTEWNWILDLPQGEYIPKPSTQFPYEKP